MNRNRNNEVAARQWAPVLDQSSALFQPASLYGLVEPISDDDEGELEEEEEEEEEAEEVENNEAIEESQLNYLQATGRSLFPLRLNDDDNYSPQNANLANKYRDKQQQQDANYLTTSTTSGSLQFQTSLIEHQQQQVPYWAASGNATPESMSAAEFNNLNFQVAECDSLTGPAAITSSSSGSFSADEQKIDSYSISRQEVDFWPKTDNGDGRQLAGSGARSKYSRTMLLETTGKLSMKTSQRL